jgi:eukaryotic-like serine/threonine-protein kinase
MTENQRIEPYLYVFKEEIGEGGFGIVYKGHEIFEDEEDLVAIKVLNPEELTESSKLRFEREIKIHSKLKHRNIVPIIDFNLNDDLNEKGIPLAYYAMPLAEENLSKFLAKYRGNHFGCMDDETALFYFYQILDGIEFAHKEGIIHRDLKPENILVFKEDDVETLKISDFGLGKFINGQTNLTRTRAALGSDVYAAPEQYRDIQNVDETADIFSLGKILYELLTYNLPVAIDYDNLRDSKLKFIIRKATHDNKEKRFKSIREMKDKIEMAMGKSTESKNPATQFNIFYNKYNESTGFDVLKDICDLMLKHNSDYILYTENFMNLEESDLVIMSSMFDEEFNEIVENYLSLINTGHPFSFTDEIANFVFYKLITSVEGNFDLYEKTLETVLKIGYGHNRFYVGETFAEELSKVEDENLIMIIGEVFENNPVQASWVKTYFNRIQTINPYLKNELDKY